MRDHVFILHVEDSLDEVELTRLAFKECKFPYEVVVVSDGARALDFLFAVGEFAGRDKSDAPALILLDLNLPKVNGFEILKRIKADPVLKAVVVVVLTSSSQDEDVRRAQEMEALFIQKPVGFDDFTAVVRRIESLIGALE